MNEEAKTSAVLAGLAVVFLSLFGVFLVRGRSEPKPPSPIPLVDPSLLAPTTFRTSYVQLVRLKADLSEFECYACHEKGKPPKLGFEPSGNLIVPPEHEDARMAHGGHNRNNNCFNCHDEQNLERFQTKDGRSLNFSESPPLCGSCHGPTYRDWEAGVHGRTGGFWSRKAGEFDRLICVDCHNPHRPKIPTLQPLPGPHPLRGTAMGAAHNSE